MANVAAFTNDPRTTTAEADRGAAFRIIQERSFKTGKEFVLSSGLRSTVYFQMKYAMLDPEGAYHLASLALRKLSGLRCTAVGGLEMGAVPIIASMAAVSYIESCPIRAFFIRKAAKQHGTRELIEGTTVEELNKCDVAVIDDVTTTGKSGLAAVEVLRAVGVSVRHAITIVDREEGAKEAFAQAGIKLHPLFRKSEFTSKI